MSENTTKKKDDLMGKVQFDMAAEDQQSRGTYNAAIGLTVIAGCLINYLMSRFLSVPMANMHPILPLVLYLAGSFGGLYIVNRSENPGAAILGFGLLAVSMGVVLTGILSHYELPSIQNAFLITAGICAVMTLVSSLAPNFFLSLGKALGITLLIVIIAEVFCLIFFRSALSIFDYVVILLFSGYIGYDWALAQQRPATLLNALRSSCAIYVDVINIFVRILSIMGKRKD